MVNKKEELGVNTMFRLKAILGGTLRGRSFVNQQAEARIIAKILNKMVQLGMPRSEKKSFCQLIEEKTGAGTHTGTKNQ
jgi:hypothetical protein